MKINLFLSLLGLGFCLCACQAPNTTNVLNELPTADGAKTEILESKLGPYAAKLNLPLKFEAAHGEEEMEKEFQKQGFKALAPDSKAKLETELGLNIASEYGDMVQMNFAFWTPVEEGRALLGLAYGHQVMSGYAVSMDLFLFSAEGKVLGQPQTLTLSKVVSNMYGVGSTLESFELSASSLKVKSEEEISDVSGEGKDKSSSTKRSYSFTANGFEKQ